MTALQTPAPDAPGEEWGALAVRIPGWQCRPDLIGWAAYRVDPDHWAWWGWFIELLGPERIAVSMWVDHITVGQAHLVMEPGAFGRACIAAAAANGRWPRGSE